MHDTTRFKLELGFIFGSVITGVIILAIAIGITAIFPPLLGVGMTIGCIGCSTLIAIGGGYAFYADEQRHSDYENSKKINGNNSEDLSKYISPNSNEKTKDYKETLNPENQDHPKEKKYSSEPNKNENPDTIETLFETIAKFPSEMGTSIHSIFYNKKPTLRSQNTLQRDNIYKL